MRLLDAEAAAESDPLGGRGPGDSRGWRLADPLPPQDLLSAASHWATRGQEKTKPKVHQ